MARLFVSSTGAVVVIASDDHCPPHVHARHRAEGWVARLWFQFESDAVGVMDVAPTNQAVRIRQLNRMLDEVLQALDTCRAVWWDGKQTTCLENKWLVQDASGQGRVIPGALGGGRHIRAARYDGGTRQTIVTFHDDAVAVVGRSA